MKCLDWKEKISGYIDGEISPAEVREVEGHLEACESCRALERRMRAVGGGVASIETSVSTDFREKLFARLEAEELLPRRRSLFVFSLRWAALPLAAAAAFGLFLLVSPEKGRDAILPQGGLPRVAQQSPPSSASGIERPVATAAAVLSPEEREIVAHLEVLEDPAALEDQGDADTIEIFGTARGRRG
jgi:anti-sigma factor RsiW